MVPSPPPPPPPYCKIPRSKEWPLHSCVTPVGPSLIPKPKCYVHLGLGTRLAGPSDMEVGELHQKEMSCSLVSAQIKLCNSSGGALGVDGLSYTSWRWVDPKGLILADIFEIFRSNSRVPPSSPVEALHCKPYPQKG